MIALIRPKKPATIIGSILLFAALGNLFPAFAQQAPAISGEEIKPLEIPTGSLEDLRGLEERRDAEWLWGVGGEFESLPTIPDSVLQPETGETEGIEPDWQNRNRGDAKSEGATFPVIDF